MKRFTETEKWRDPWFYALEPKHRMLWFWLCDRVDNAGVVDIIWDMISFETKTKFTEQDIDSLGDRVERMENGKYFLPGFVPFQFGELSDHSKVHQSIMKIRKKHGIKISRG